MKSIGGVKAENGVSSKPSEEVKAEPEKIDFSNVKIEPLFEEEVDFDTFSKSDFRAVKVKECVAVPKSKKLLQFTLDDGTGTDRTILSGIHAYYEPEELVGKTLIAITNLPPRKMMGIESCGMLLSAVNNLKDSEDEELHLLSVNNYIYLFGGALAKMRLWNCHLMPSSLALVFQLTTRTFVTGTLTINVLALLLMPNLKPHKRVFMLSVMQQHMKVRLT